MLYSDKALSQLPDSVSGGPLTCTSSLEGMSPHWGGGQNFLESILYELEQTEFHNTHKLPIPSMSGILYIPTFGWILWYGTCRYIFHTYMDAMS